MLLAEDLTTQPFRERAMKKYTLYILRASRNMPFLTPQD